MRKLEPEELEAVCQLNTHSPHFKTFLGWLKASRDEEVEVFPKIRDINDLTRLQGSVKSLSEILEEVSAAEETLQKLKGGR